MRANVRGAGERGSHTYTQITHQELPQVFVVGDDAIVDDNELWGQRRGPTQPHTSAVSDSREHKALCGKCLAEQEEFHLLVRSPCSAPLGNGRRS